MKAHELLSDASKWIQHHAALDVNGEPTNCGKGTAVCWCLFGAVAECYSTPEKWSPCNEIMARLDKELGNLVQWNDEPGRKFEEVREVLLKLDI